MTSFCLLTIADRTRSRPRPVWSHGTADVMCMLIRCFTHAIPCYMGTLRELMHHIQAMFHSLGASNPMKSAHVAFATPPSVRPRVATMAMNLRWRCSEHVDIMNMQPNGAYCFSMINAARPDGLVSVRA